MLTKSAHKFYEERTFEPQKKNRKILQYLRNLLPNSIPYPPSVSNILWSTLAEIPLRYHNDSSYNPVSMAL